MGDKHNVRTKKDLKKTVLHLEEIANSEGLPTFFAGLGIKGSLYDDENCPVANYMKLHGFEKVSVSEDSFDTDIDGETIVQKTPKKVGKFIDKFDKKKYPELIIPASDEEVLDLSQVHLSAW